MPMKHSQDRASLFHCCSQVRTFLNNILLEVPKPATWAVSEHVPPECEEWILGGRGKKLRHNFCRTYAIDSSVCANLTVTFIRNDHLQVCRVFG